MLEALIARLKATGKSLDSLQELLAEELKELYDVEDRLVDTMPKLIEAASSPMVKQAFGQHLERTRQHRRRLEQVFAMMNMDPEKTSSAGMKGLIEQCCYLMSASGDPKVRDAALITGCQRIEHYEIACYGAARTYAQLTGRSDVAAILQQTLDEEGDADKKLTEVALSGIDQQAAVR